MKKKTKNALKCDVKKKKKMEPKIKILVTNSQWNFFGTMITFGCLKTIQNCYFLQFTMVILAFRDK